MKNRVFTPSRTAGLAHLDRFVPRAGKTYAASRNTDEGEEGESHVSMLSPYIRHRLLHEHEVLAQVIAHHGLQSAEKFVQEVFWRAYFKGHLETRPVIWSNYLRDLAHVDRLSNYNAAIKGQTGIDCFDHWVGELQRTGYLHNHARMWFASIWIFTLRLPWVLGADFMYRNLLDGDPASNTLSWRWVAGLHTRGKTYLATPDNIARYTDGRFSPKGLASLALPLDEPELPQAKGLPAAQHTPPNGRFGLLMHEEELHVPLSSPPESTALANMTPRSGGPACDRVITFITEAIEDAAIHHGATRIASLGTANVLRWCQSENLTTIATPYAPVGPVADAITILQQELEQHGISLLRLRRRYDTLVWPHCSKGFFALKEKIPSLVAKLGIGQNQRDLI